MIQTTAYIINGSSGGALLDLNGNLVGITTQGIVGTSLNFAIRIDEFEKMIKLFTITKDCFFCELTTVNSVGVDHNISPLFIEKHLKVFSISTTNIFWSLILIWELKEEECFFFQIKSSSNEMLRINGGT